MPFIPTPKLHTLIHGWGTYLVSRAAWTVHYRWRAAKSNDFILKFYLYLTMRSDFSWLMLCACLPRSFLTKGCFALTWVMQSLMRAYQIFTRAAGSPPLL